MAVKVAELYETLELRDSKFKRGMGSAKKQSGSLMKTLGKAGLVGAAVGVGAAFVGMAKKGVTAFMELETGMAEVFTLMPEASKKARDQMTSDLRAFSTEMGVATNESAPALYQAISAGVPKDNVFTFMEEAQKAAVAGVTDLQTSVDVLTSVVNTYGADTMSAKKASDIMFTAVKEGKTTFSELSANMSDVAPIASSMGIEFSNVAAALSTMTSQGTPTSQATTQLKQAMAELSKEGSKAGTAFRDVAGKDFQTFITEGGNLQEAMALMETAAKDNGTTVSNMFGSIEAGQAALALTGKGAIKFKDDLKEMETSAGATGEAYDTMDATMARSMKKLSVLANDVFQEIGKKLAPIVNKLVNFLIDAMPTIKRVVSGAFNAIISIFSSTSDTANKLKDTFGGVFEDIKVIIKTFVSAAVSFWNTLGDDILLVIQTAFNTIKIVINTILGTIKGLIKIFKGIITGDFEEIKKGLTQIWDSLWSGIRDVVANVWNNLLKKPFNVLWTNIKEYFGTLKDNMIQLGRDIIAGLVSGITEKIQMAKDTISNVGNAITGTFKSLLGIESPSKVFAGYGRNLMRGLSLGIDNEGPSVIETLIKVVEDIRKAAEFEIKWADKLFGQTATIKEKLEKQKKLVLQYADDIGADTLAVKQYFANEEARIKEEQMQKEKAFNKKRVEEHQATVDRIKKQQQERLASLQRKVDAYIAEKEREAESEQEIQDKREKEHQATLDRIKQQQADHLADMQKKVDVYYAERESFEQKWTNKLFEQTATRLEILERDKEEALRVAREKGADTTELLQVFANERKKILDEEKTNEEKTLDELLIDYQDFGTGLGNVFGNMKIAIQNWTISMKENTKEASQSFADAMVDMADSVISGQKTMKEALKDILISFITMLEKQVIATQIAEQAKALMMAPLSFGATLAAIPPILAAAAPALVAFEAVKAGIRGLAEGGTLTSPGSVLVGESGPELLNLPKGASVAPLGQASSGPKSINVMVQLDGKTIMKAIKQPLADTIRIKGGVRY